MILMFSRCLSMEFSMIVSERSFLYVLHEFTNITVLDIRSAGSHSVFEASTPRNSSLPFSASRLSGIIWQTRARARAHSSSFRVSNPYDTIRYDTIRYDTIRYDTAFYDGEHPFAHLPSVSSVTRFSCFRRLRACLFRYFSHTRTFDPRRDGLSPPPDLSARVCSKNGRYFMD